jgi:hypothetical protein
MTVFSEELGDGAVGSLVPVEGVVCMRLVVAFIFGGDVFGAGGQQVAETKKVFLFQEGLALLFCGRWRMGTTGMAEEHEDQQADGLLQAVYHTGRYGLYQIVPTCLGFEHLILIHMFNFTMV